MYISIFILFLAFCIPLSVGYAASALSVGSSQMYATFILPPLSPPSTLFGPVWTVIYILMGVASFLVWRAPVTCSVKGHALLLYIIQLGINFLWPFFFFNLQCHLFAFFWLLLLLGTLLVCMRAFKSISPWAFYLLIPYMLWGLFAAYLNLGIYILNG